ncbi:5230_t:CDS:1 [Paraglomus occultum]|uniref:5230_t:CDS:1 n=1 Tax=Paraglomus occultum TaxID=144539 RepID=A0A9N9C9U8_9GLOM|nr:5230_t:CDS:1 [Paraglomus occultum]
MDNNLPQKYSSSSLARRIGKSKPMNTSTLPTERNRGKGSQSGPTARKSTSTSRHIGQKESTQSSIKCSPAQTGNINSTSKERSWRSEGMGNGQSPSGSHTKRSPTGGNQPLPSMKHSPYSPPYTTAPQSALQSSMTSSTGQGPTRLTPLQVQTLKRGRKLAGKGLPKGEINQYSEESTKKRLSSSGIPTQTKSQSPRSTQPQHGPQIRKNQWKKQELPHTLNSCAETKRRYAGSKTSATPSTKKRKMELKSGRKSASENQDMTLSDPGYMPTTKMDGCSEWWNNNSKSPPSRKRKSSGPTPAPEPKKLKNTPVDTGTMKSTGTAKDKKRWTSSTSVDGGTKPNNLKRKAVGEEDRVSGKADSPISIPSPSTTPKTPISGEPLKNSPLNPGGNLEDEVDFNFWLNDAEFEPFAGDKAIANELTEETAILDEFMVKRSQDVDENSLAGAKELELEGMNVGDDNFISLDFNIDEFINSIDIDNHIKHCDEAENLAKSLHLFLEEHNINHLYLVTRGGNISFTSITDLEGSLTLGFGGEEVLAQLAIFNDRVQELEKLVKKYNL